MNLAGICIETDNVPRLVKFYEKLFGIKAEGDEIHSSFNDLKLAIFNPGNIRLEINEKQNKNFVLMFEVNDVDLEYERLKDHVDIVVEPKDKPWGTRAFSISDPDGNRINLLSVNNNNGV